MFATCNWQRSPLHLTSGEINPSIKKEEAKVVDMLDAGEIKGKAVMCRCWRSGTFPNCDGAHVKHNKVYAQPYVALSCKHLCPSPIPMRAPVHHHPAIYAYLSRRLGTMWAL